MSRSIADGLSLRAVTELGIETSSETIELGGDFNAGESVQVTKVGSIVTIKGIGILSHASTDSPAAAAGVIPAQYRPSDVARNLFMFQTTPGQNIQAVSVFSDGSLIINYTDFTGTPLAKTDVISGLTITYTVD